MRLYNTLTRQVEPFDPPHDPVRIYVCGITPYADAHLGHAMSAVIFDTLRGYLEWRGRRVRFVYNYTDIDDKMIDRAQRLGISVPELAARMIIAFEDDMRALNIRAADVHPRATQEIAKIREVIGGLVAADLAYPAGGDVYFRVTARADYGKLSHRSLEGMIAGARIEPAAVKEHPMDFVLWKGARPGEPAWDSPWGPGRPGWHIECSAMALRYLGEEVDLHGGGMDLIFPHHENEIAQSEGFTGHVPFVRHWMHNAMLQLGNEKMSKSLGNIITIRRGLDTYGADALRIFILSGHYRSPLRYSEASLAAAQRGAERLRLAIVAPLPPGDGRLDPAAFRQRFTDAMDDDLGAPQALAVLFDLAREINRARDDRQPAAAAVGLLRELGGVLGLRFQEVRHAADAAPFLDLLVDLREQLRQDRHFTLADRIRDRLRDLGVALEDGRDGTAWRIVSSAGALETGGGQPAVRPGEAVSGGMPPDVVESTLRF